MGKEERRVRVDEISGSEGVGRVVDVRVRESEGDLG